MFKKNNFIKVFGLLLIAALFFAMLPSEGAVAQAGDTLYVAEWTSPATAFTPASGAPRPTVVFDGTLYHLWYGIGDDDLYHTTSATPDSFPTGTLTTYDTDEKPYEVSSPTIVLEDGTLYMIVYNPDVNIIFSVYTSSDGVAWDYQGDVYDGAGLGTQGTDWRKFDAPVLLKDDSTYKLYFQVAPVSGDYKIFMAETGATTLAEIADGDNDNDFTLANSNNPVLTVGASGDPDETHVQHPMVVKDDGLYFMWYTGVAPSGSAYYWRSLNFATSPDGITWTKSPGNPVVKEANSHAEAMALKVGDVWHLWHEYNESSVQYLSAYGPFEFQSIQGAIDAATSGDVIKVSAGTYVLTDELTVNKAVTLTGVDNPLIQVSGTGYRINMNTPGATLQGFHIEKTDKAGVQNIIYVGANDLTIQNNKIWGQFEMTDSDVSRAMEFPGGLSGLLIANNEIFDLRQPAYINGVSTGDISSNYVYRTKGWVVAGGNLTFTDNTWGTGEDSNYFDIAILAGVDSAYYTDIPAMSEANNDAVIEDQRTSPPTLSIVYVDGSVTTSGTGTAQSPVKTIEEGIDRVVVGGTIYVAEGTYDEDIEISKELNLLGPNEGVSPITGSRVAEAVITSSNTTSHNVRVRSNDVRIEGFKFADSEAINVIWADSNDSDNDNFVFKSNLLVNNNGPVYLGAGPSSGWEIKDNKIESVSSTSSNVSGLFLLGLSNATISDNWIQNTTYAGMLLDSLTNSTVSRNIIKDVPGVGIQIANESGGVDIFANEIDNVGQTLQESDKGGIRLYGTALTGAINIYNNEVTNSYNGIGIRDSIGCDLQFVKIYDNFLATNSTYQIYNGCDDTLDASGNWYGTAVPAEVAASIMGDVDYTPWLATGTDTSTDPGFQGDFSILWVDDDSPQTAMYGRIQEGVNLVTESTVYVADGTYIEEILINKPVHIIGQGPGTIIQSPDEIEQLFGTSSHPIVLIKDTDDVTIESLVIDGAGKGNANHKFVGVAFSNAGGLLQDLTVTGIIDTPFSGVQHGVAVSAYNTDGETRSISLQDNTFIDFQKNAMAINANATTPLMIDIQGNTITGAGATDVTAQNGIQVWAAEAEGIIANNTVTGIGYSGSGWVGSSILIYQNNFGDLLIDNNTIIEAQMGVYVFDGSAMISNNNIEVEKIGDFSYGIIATDPPNAQPQPYGEESLEVSVESTGTRGATLPVSIVDNKITLAVDDEENGVVAAATWGILAEGGWTLFDLDLTITGNNITGFDYGVEIYQAEEETGEIVSVEAHQNCIVDSTVYAMLSNAEAITVNAINNFWGDPSGPFHPTLNPDGEGGEVSDDIDFEPWLEVCPLKAYIQLAHLAPFAENASVSITLNGTEVLKGFGYGASTEYLEVEPGEYDVEVIPTGATDPAITGTINLMANGFYTAIAVGDGTNQVLDLILLEDDLTPPADGMFHLRLGHLAPFASGSATADIRLRDGTPVLLGVEYGDVTDFIPLPAGTYDLIITSPGGGQVLIDPLPVTFAEGDIISAFATGDGDNQPLGVFGLPAGDEGFFLPLREYAFRYFFPLFMGD